MRALVRGARVAALAAALSGLGATRLFAQDPRDAMVARAFNEFDAAKRLQLLMSAVNPTAGPPRGAWPVGVQLLAQTLIEDHKDSVAKIWLRWAVRLSPDLQPDTLQFLPKVVSVYRSARDFVLATRGPGDSAAATTWLWPGQNAADQTGRLQIAASSLTVPMRVAVKGFGPVAPGGSLTLNPGSYEISAAATGYDSIHVTREVLPGVTTVLEFHLRVHGVEVAHKPAPAAPAQPVPAPAAAQEKKKGFPVIAVVGVVGAVGIAAALAGGGGGSSGGGGGGGGGGGSTGSISITFPNP